MLPNAEIPSRTTNLPAAVPVPNVSPVAVVTLRPAKLGVAVESMFWIVLMVPLLAVKFVLLNWAIPLLEVVASSIVIVLREPLELAIVKTPIRPSTLVTPPPGPPVQAVKLRTPEPLLVIQSPLAPAVIGRVKVTFEPGLPL